MTVPDFSKIWASQSSLNPYEFDDADYLEGWEFIGEIPPDRRMFDTWQKQADTKMLWLKNNMLGYLLRQNSTQYAVGDIAFSASLPSSLVLECTTAGITAASEPDMSGAEAGGTVTDGEVVWTYRNILDGSNMVHHKDVITTSGTYTAPATGLYKITVKGGGGGGAGGYASGSFCAGGSGGGEGGTTIGYEYMSAGDTASVVIGAGGIGGAALVTDGNDGGNSSVTVNSNTYTGGGGGGAGGFTGTRGGGAGGTGTIYGAAGGSWVNGTLFNAGGGNGGGNGGGRGETNNSGNRGVDGINGGGGSGALLYPGGNGGDGFVWFEYFAEV